VSEYSLPDPKFKLVQEVYNKHLVRIQAKRQRSSTKAFCMKLSRRPWLQTQLRTRVKVQDFGDKTLVMAALVIALPLNTAFRVLAQAFLIQPATRRRLDSRKRMSAEVPILPTLPFLTLHRGHGQLPRNLIHATRILEVHQQ
jgi:hypothetical protein